MISEFFGKKLTLVGLLVLVFCPAVLSAHVPQPPKDTVKSVAAVNVKAPDFVLMNQDNQRFDSAQLRDKITVLNFIFTTCTDVCPIFTANLAQIQHKLNGRYSNDLFFVSITTDPEVDSAKVLKAYGKRYNADFQNWAFLTGTPAQLKEVWRSFGITVIRRGRGLIQHTSLTTVIDRRGTRKFDHRGEKWRGSDLERDLLTLLEKKS